ncbi:adenylate/guanylate cyclase domain-containing protein [Bradyrhizobium sp. RDM4]|uniref:adenylate/guanylate cyclase domain-containing protein n=1 Tax=Bradyrhizobium sp. RDM4 TaxID=3378765 RepID=UPI0038FC1499
MKDLDLPETHYALSGEVNIAYQWMGNGPIDLVFVPGFMSHIEFMHELPGYTSFLRRLSKFARVITFDKRGQGLSDRVSDAPSLEQRMDDVRAVMDAVGSNRAVLFGNSEGGAMSALFAATYPDRVSRLLLFGGYANRRDMSADLEDRLQQRVKFWGTGALMRIVAPSSAISPDAIAQFAKFERLSASPGAVKSFMRLNSQIDIRSILPTVRVPTLVFHRTDDKQVPIALGRELASLMPEAKFIEYPGQDHAVAAGDVEALLGDIEEFVTGHRNNLPDESERILATVLFSDIVDSTRTVAEKGDAAWRKVLDSHDQLSLELVQRHRGRLIKSTGDGFLAIFDGPGRAVRCALAMSAASNQMGLRVRAGLHTGEIEVRGRDIGGIAVHAASRVMAQSPPDEVLVSKVVTDLTAGAGLQFSERGSHELKGLPGRWDLFAASV